MILDGEMEIEANKMMTPAENHPQSDLENILGKKKKAKSKRIPLCRPVDTTWPTFKLSDWPLSSEPAL